MKTFKGKIAVVTGGGTGMGRELVRQLARSGCNVAMCDVIEENMHETLSIVSSESPEVQVSAHFCDVSLEDQVIAFKEAMIKEHETTHINLLFNNAGIGGGGSFLEGDKEEWEKTFAICWYGVYYCSRAFMPYLVASKEGHIINTSSVNGFWASLGGMPYTSYSSAKFAVKGFTEALIQDCRVNAPHVKASVVMPGHIGTSIAINSGKILGHADVMDLSDEEVKKIKELWISLGAPVHNQSNDQIREALKERRESFKDNAPTSAEQAAKIILNGVKEEKWRILVGDDAHNLDKRVRENPEKAYDPDFVSPFSDLEEA